MKLGMLVLFSIPVAQEGQTTLTTSEDFRYGERSREVHSP